MVVNLILYRSVRGLAVLDVVVVVDIILRTKSC